MIRMVAMFAAAWTGVAGAVTLDGSYVIVRPDAGPQCIDAALGQAAGVLAKSLKEGAGLDVKVVKVNTMHVNGKLKRTGRYPAGRRPSWKKAVVTLSDDSKSIEFFEGMA